MKGSTTERPLPEVVRDLLFDRAEGVLAVRSGDRTVELLFAGGGLVDGRDQSPDQRLDRVLVRWGLLKESEVAAFFQEAGSDVRGAIVKRGIMPDAGAFDEFMRDVLRERVLSAFSLPAADYDFEQRDLGDDRTRRLATSSPNVVLEGARRMTGQDETLRPLLDDNPVLSLNPTPGVAVESLEMSTAEGYVLSQIAASVPLKDVVSVSPLQADETIRLVYGLLLLDVVQHPSFAGYRFSVDYLGRKMAEQSTRDSVATEMIAAEYERVRKIDVFQLVPNTEALDRDQLREALHRYRADWSEERFSESVVRSMRDQLTFIAGRATEALLGIMESAQTVARGPSTGDAVEAVGLRRMEFSKTEAQAEEENKVQLADTWLAKAREALVMKDYHQAIQFTREAIRKHETAEAQALLAECLLKNPHWRQKAEEAYKRAIQLDEFDPRLHYELGRLYMKGGLKQRAQREFQRAIELNKDFDDARRALRELKRS